MLDRRHLYDLDGSSVKHKRSRRRAREPVEAVDLVLGVLSVSTVGALLGLLFVGVWVALHGSMVLLYVMSSVGDL